MNVIGVPEKKKKKPPKNAYYFFMLEYKRKLEERGQHVTMGEVQAMASEPWNKLTTEEKKMYSDMAAMEKQTTRGDPNMKFTSLGVSLAVLDAEEKKAKEKEMIIEKTINNAIRGLDDSTIRTHKFYFCHVNFYYKFEGKCRPAEIAIVEFCLQDGITNSYHRFLHPGVLPMGVRRQAMERTKEIHGIPISDFRPAVRDYRKVFGEIVQFVSRNRKIEPIYTRNDNENSNMSMAAVVDALEFLADCDNQPSDVFRVFPLTKLFFELKNKCAEDKGDTFKFPTLAVVEGVIEKDVFSYASDLACEFHENSDEEGVSAIHCSLSIATRWAFTVCDHCCKLIKIPMSPGDHCPKEVDTAWETKHSVSQKLKGLSVQEVRRLKEERAKHFDEQEKVLQENTRLPAQGMRDADQGAPVFNQNDFPDLGFSSRGPSAGSSNQKVFWPIAGRGRGRGARDN